MTRYTKRGGQVWIKIFPDKPVSKKALGVRMGSGKGAPEYWVAVVKNQKVIDVYKRQVASYAGAQQFFRQMKLAAGRVRSAMLIGGGRIAYYLAKDVYKRQPLYSLAPVYHIS